MLGCEVSHHGNLLIAVLRVLGIAHFVFLMHSINVAYGSGGNDVMSDEMLGVEDEGLEVGGRE